MARSSTNTRSNPLLPADAQGFAFALLAATAVFACLACYRLERAARQSYLVLLQEALRNAAVPALALTGVQFTFLIGGTVITERIFSYPGIGNLAIDAVINRDLPLIQGLVLVFGALFILINLGVDLLYGLVNPRIRHAR